MHVPHFVMIPGVVDEDPRLHPNSKRLCGYITSLTRTDIGCVASNGYFAKRLNVSIATVKRYMKQLKDFGYIEIDYNNQNKRFIVVTSKVLVTAVRVKKESKGTYTPEWVDSIFDDLGEK